jgi:hypothetical protein
LPEYTYAHPETGETVNVIQRMTEEHRFSRDGVEWKRVFYSNNMSVDAKIDPCNSRDFVEKTGKKKGTLGNITDAAKEASLQREKIFGKDPVREKWEENWSKKRGGKKFPSRENSTLIV